MTTHSVVALTICAIGLSSHVTAPVLEAQSGHGECAQIASLKLPEVTISEAVAVPAATTGAIRAAHCRVNGVIGTEIKFSLLMPDQWNGKFMMGGGGGYVGSVQNMAAGSIELGYATVGTDTGHTGGLTDASWALDNLERHVNFGYLAVHRTSEVAKAIIRDYYHAPITRSYFSGCSNGGRQALMSAQRYPEDFEGIIAAAPAYDFVGLAAQFIKDAQASFTAPASTATRTLTPEILKSVEAQIVEKCDAVDGVKDGLFEDPRRCKIDVDALTGLTSEQRGALKKVYGETKGSNGTIYFGQPVGGEAEGQGWPMWITGPAQPMTPQGPSLRHAFGTQFFKYFVFNDPNWDYLKYDISSARKDARLAAATLSATSTDLDAFKNRGGKLIMWHGWSDPALTAFASVAYYEQVQKRDPNVNGYLRMFMAPGVLHCMGGPGPLPTNATWFKALEDWVENGKAPERIVATRTAGGVTRTRPLCPYPQQAVYNGSGSIDDEKNFVCR